MRVLLTLTVLVPSIAYADPCGMVPPLWTGPGPAITRVGEQLTYAFFKDGMETFVIRPGFTGKVDNFGMLIPFPSVPAIRKVPDDLFTHIAAAVDPPEIIIDLRPRPPPRLSRSMAPASAPRQKSERKPLEYDEVRVVKQEAVGMYEITVLEAGSARALKRWLDDNGYVYPKGMDGPVNDYVALGWPFVAVKTRVGSAGNAAPRAGARKVNPSRPAGSTFTGQVQAMGFRFRVEEPVIPMRLSAFNEGSLRNIVYFLDHEPVRIRGLDAALVKRQVPGKDMWRNVTQLLPVRILGGTAKDVPAARWTSIEPSRDPHPHNGKARELFASDLLALKRGGDLSLPFEEKEKVLLRVGEALNLRGPAIDRMNDEALATERGQTLGKALSGLQGMTMNVFDGDFPRGYIRDYNLTFIDHRIPELRNNAIAYNARSRRTGYDQGGVVVWGRRGRGEIAKPKKSSTWWRFW